MVDETVLQAIRRLPAATAERAGTAPTATVRPDARVPTTDPTPLPIIPLHGGDLALGAVLGEGGMGRVTLAQQRSLGREVAVKSLLPERPSALAEAALLAEGRAAGGLEHPNIVPVHALGRDESGGPVLVMKRVEGTSWRDRIADGDLERNLEILIQVCNAVHFAHTRGVLHRDIKPENVMLGDFGEVYLVDWGIALRLAERELATDLAGTPAYLAPEMLAGGTDLSPRTDVYLLGATLHEILSGRPPHRGATLREVLSSVAAPEAPVVDGPAALVAICRRALDPVPQRRFFSAAELRDALVAFLRHRASDRLADDARPRLDEAKRAESSAEKRRLLVESQFGLRQALREWSDNAAARTALADCLAELARLEIAEGNRGAAELLVAELREPPADLADALAALAKRLAADEAGRRRLEAIDRDQDFTVSRRARLIIASILVVLNLASIAGWLATEQPLRMTPAELVRGTGGITLVCLAIVLFARRALFRNRANRQAVLSFLAMVISLLLYHALALLRGQPVEETLAESMLLCGLGSGLVAVLLARWFLVVGLLIAAAGAVGTLWPEATYGLWGFATSVPLVAMIIVWARPPAR